MMIARRADTRARADFATWNMMAKLNGASSLPPEARSFLDRHKTLLKDTTEAEATDAIIQLIYKSYYEEMGGAGEPPDVKSYPVRVRKVTDNITAFKRPPPRPPKTAAGPRTKPRLPVALIFACLVLVYTGFRYFFR